MPLATATLRSPTAPNVHEAIPLPRSRHCSGTPPIELPLQTLKTCSPETTQRLAKENTSPISKKKSRPTSRRRYSTEHIPCNFFSAYLLSMPKTQRLGLLCWRQGFHQRSAQLRNRQPSVAYPRSDASGGNSLQTLTKPFRSLVHGIVAELFPSQTL